MTDPSTRQRTPATPAGRRLQRLLGRYTLGGAAFWMGVSVFGAVEFATMFAHTLQPRGGLLDLFRMLLSLSTFAVLAGLVLTGLVWWRTRLLGHVLACAALVLAFVGGVRGGGALRDVVFQHQLARWYELVTWVTTHHRPNGGDPIVLPPHLTDLAMSTWHLEADGKRVEKAFVFYRHDVRCGLVIDVPWGGFGRVSILRRYVAAPHLSPEARCPDDRIRGRPLADRWYESYHHWHMPPPAGVSSTPEPAPMRCPAPGNPP